jgi:hypothetical protein
MAGPYQFCIDSRFEFLYQNILHQAKIFDIICSNIAQRKKDAKFETIHFNRYTWINCMWM